MRSSARCVVVLSVLLLASPAGAQVFRGELFETTSGPGRVVLADMDGDGDLDAVAHITNSGIEVLLNDGGRYESTSFKQQGGDFLPVDFAVGDMDEDGALDVVTSSTPSFVIDILFGDGAGGLTAPVPHSSGVMQWHMLLADMNGDEHLDVVTVDNLSSVVSVVLGDGAGNLGTPQVFAAASSVARPAVADVDGDGDLDLALPSASPTTTLTLLLNDGTGQLGAPVQIELGDEATDLAAGDVDGDGRDEIVADRPGTFAALVQADGLGGWLVDDLPATLRNPVLADADGDLDLDLLSHDWAGVLREPWVLHGDGAGNFAAPVAVGPTRPWPFRYTAADVDGDLVPDLLFSHDTEEALSVQRGDGLGGFETTLAVGSSAQGFLRAGGDFDGDGETDLVLLDGAFNSVAVLFGLGGGAFEPADTYTVGGNPSDVALADLDGDGLLDILTADQDSDSVAWLRNLGSRTFLLADQFGVGAGSGPMRLSVGDLDDDGLLDVVIGGFDDMSIGVRLGIGGGSLGPLETALLPIVPLDLDLADLDEDGVLDAVLNGTLPRPFPLPQVAVLLGDGTGGFGPAQLFSAVAGRQALGDLDGDGKRDIVVESTGPDGFLAIGLGNGTGGFAIQPVQSLGNDHNGPWLGDLTGDGVLDLLLAHDDEHTVSVSPGNGVGGFGAGTRYFVGGLFPSFAVADDVHGDGRPDLYVQAASQMQQMINVADPFTWSVIDAGLAGGFGVPELVGTGTLEAGQPVELNLDGVPPGAAAALVIGVSRIDLPFKGGTLVPAPDVLIAGLPIGSDGFLTLFGHWPPGAPSGFQTWYQAWTVDPGAPSGLSASNALRATVP